MSLTSHRVLIVEDEFLIAMDLTDIIRDAGALVVGPAATVREALNLLEDQVVHAAVVDINLGEENSLAVALALENSGIPFVYHTAHEAPGTLGWPVAPIVRKPSIPTALISAISTLLDPSH